MDLGRINLSIGQSYSRVVRMLGAVVVLAATARSQRCSAQAALASKEGETIDRLIDGVTPAVPLGVPAQPSVWPRRGVCGSARR